MVAVKLLVHYSNGAWSAFPSHITQPQSLLVGCIVHVSIQWVVLKMKKKKSLFLVWTCCHTAQTWGESNEAKLLFIATFALQILTHFFRFVPLSLQVRTESGRGGESPGQWPGVEAERRCCEGGSRQTRTVWHFGSRHATLGRVERGDRARGNYAAKHVCDEDARGAVNASAVVHRTLSPLWQNEVSAAQKESARTVVRVLCGCDSLAFDTRVNSFRYRRWCGQLWGKSGHPLGGDSEVWLRLAARIETVRADFQLQAVHPQRREVSGGAPAGAGCAGPQQAWIPPTARQVPGESCWGRQFPPYLQPWLFFRGNKRHCAGDNFLQGTANLFPFQHSAVSQWVSWAGSTRLQPRHVQGRRSESRMPQRRTPWLVWTLQGSFHHSDQTSLVVETTLCVGASAGDAGLQRLCNLSGGGQLYFTGLFPFL